MSKREMGTQQRLFSESGDAFNKTTEEFSVRVNTLIPNMRRHLSDLMAEQQRLYKTVGSGSKSL